MLTRIDFTTGIPTSGISRDQQLEKAVAVLNETIHKTTQINNYVIELERRVAELERGARSGS